LPRLKNSISFPNGLVMIRFEIINHDRVSPVRPLSLLAGYALITFFFNGQTGSTGEPASLKIKDP
jgi:hypothetical protein